MISNFSYYARGLENWFSFQKQAGLCQLESVMRPKSSAAFSVSVMSNANLCFVKKFVNEVYGNTQRSSETEAEISAETLVRLQDTTLQTLIIQVTGMHLRCVAVLVRQLLRLLCHARNLNCMLQTIATI
jgi:hypothetical protein